MDSTTIDNDYWQDITEVFMTTVKHLELGELYKSDHFTLLEAMSAIELMDPKMDSGMIFKKCKRKILTFEQAVKVGNVKINQLELNELIGIIDETYARLTTWLEGHPLDQTVMTNLYLHEPERIEDRCLRIFSQSILNLVNRLNNLVQAVFCIEEEDFQLNHGKFNLVIQISDQKVLASIEDLCQHYEKILSERQPAPSNQNHTNKKQQHLKNGREQRPSSTIVDEHDKSLLIGIINRLRFTYHFYACFLILHKSHWDEHWDIRAQTDAQLLKTIKSVQTSTLNCDQHLEKCQKFLEKWQATIELGIKPKQSMSEENYDDGDYPTIMGFEPFINHYLIPPVYPRCSSIKSRPVTIEYLKNLIIRLRQCTAISSSFNQKSFNKSSDLIENFTKYFRPSSCVISRSLIQVLYLPNRSINLLKEELLLSMLDYCGPSVNEMRKDEAKRCVLNEFLDESSKLFSQIINIYGHNPVRQHEKFTELIPSFKNLQYSTYVSFNNSTIYSWTTYQLARMCIKYILSSLELELFSTHEYPYVFWYLYDVLYRNEKEQLEQARQVIHKIQLEADETPKKNKSKKQRKKSQFNTSYHDNGLLCNDAYRFLTGGLFLLTYGLKVQGKIRSPLMECTSEEICFEHRFGFLTGTDVYQSYKQTLSRLEKLEYIYREALECFSEAKDLFEAVPGQHENCLRVCKTNMVVARILTTNFNSLTDREVEFNFDTHPSFPTVKV